MTEEFLHYVWKYRLYNPSISLDNGEFISIIKTGSYNTNSGPDFFNALIKIGTTSWAGNIEIHVNASDWFRHKHQSNPAYDNIILHVVYNNDAVIQRSNNDPIPTLVLREQFDPMLYNLYDHLIHNRKQIPCEELVDLVDPIKILHWYDRLATERLESVNDSIRFRIQSRKCF